MCGCENVKVCMRVSEGMSGGTDELLSWGHGS